MIVSNVSWAIYQGVANFVRIVSGLIFLYCLLSWFMRPDSKLFRVISRVVQPILEPFRPLGNKLIQLGFRVDLTPWVAIVVLELLVRVLYFLLIRFC